MGGTGGGDAMAGMGSMPGMKHDMSAMGVGDHAEHGGWRKRKGTSLSGPDAFVPIDRVIATVAPMGLAYPVLVSPPSSAGGKWTAKSDTQDRPLRVDLVLDGATGALLHRTDFAQKPWLDRAIGTGIAAHEGALFGVANQIVSLLTVLGLVALSVSGLAMWWKRKPEGALGAPISLGRVRFSAGLVGLMVVLGVYFPFLGGSMLLIGLTERFVLRRIPATRHWLGLQAG
jgi:uncharacterized iron-regulated membrane protein